MLLVGGRAPWYPAQRRPTAARSSPLHENPHKGHMVYQTLHADFYLEGDIADSLELISAAAKAAKRRCRGRSRRAGKRWTREHESYVAGLQGRAGEGSERQPGSIRSRCWARSAK